MSLFPNLRMFVLLRRGVRALESIAKSQAQLAQCMQDEWADKFAPRKPKPVEFGTVDAIELNKRYRERIEAERAGIDPEDVQQ
jgi:hypothetical protein